MTIIASAETASGTGPWTAEPASPAHLLAAVIAKELRQNLISLALVYLIEFMLIMFEEWFRSGFWSETRGTYLNVLLDPSVRAAIPFACAAAGLCLGIAQPV
jgi:hypothetical protein